MSTFLKTIYPISHANILQTMSVNMKGNVDSLIEFSKGLNMFVTNVVIYSIARLISSDILGVNMVMKSARNSKKIIVIMEVNVCSSISMV